MLRRFCVPFFSGSAGAKVVPAQAPGAVHAICVWCRCIAGQAGCPAVNDATPRLGGYPHTHTHTHSILSHSLSPFFAPFLCSACVCSGRTLPEDRKKYQFENRNGVSHSALYNVFMGGRTIYGGASIAYYYIHFDGNTFSVVFAQFTHILFSSFLFLSIFPILFIYFML